MFYRVRRANGSTFRRVFLTYEEARAFARKRIRATVAQAAAFDQWDKVSRNPVSIRRYGYQIVPVKASAVSVSLT